MSTPQPILEWENLVEQVNGRRGIFGTAGVRDPQNPCELFDGLRFDGTGECQSDGHYLCTECSRLSPKAPRFEEFDRDGRRDRLRLYWRRNDPT